STTRTGFPEASRCSRRRCRFMGCGGAPLQVKWRSGGVCRRAQQFTGASGENAFMNDRSDLVADELEERLLALRPGVDQLGLPACVLDRSLRYHYLNATYVAYVGRPASDFIGRTPDEIFERVPTDDRRRQMQRALDGEPVVFYRRTMEGPKAGQWVQA